MFSPRPSSRPLTPATLRVRLGEILRSYPARAALLSALAAAIAYGLGSLTPQVSAVVAGITALITVRPTFHASIQEALRQVIGVILGAGFALLSAQLLGFTALSIFLAVVACFITAALLKLGEEGAMALGVTVILVLGPQFDTQAIETRLLGVIVGGVVALAVSYFIRPGTPHGRALADVVTRGERTSRLLTDIGRALASSHGQVPAADARVWLAEAEAILRDIVEIRHAATDAVEGARWSPMIGREEAEAVLAQVSITENTAVTVVSMCRDLVVAAQHRTPMPSALAESLSHVLIATAEAIEEQSDIALDSPADALPEATDSVSELQRSRREAVATVRELDETRQLLLGGSLLRDSEKITEILAGR